MLGLTIIFKHVIANRKKSKIMKLLQLYFVSNLFSRLSNDLRKLQRK